MRLLIAIALLLGSASASEAVEQLDSCGNVVFPPAGPQTSQEKAQYEKWMGRVRFTRVRIVGAKMPSSELAAVKAALLQPRYTGIESQAEMQERARDQFQSRGYFKVQITPEFKITSGTKCSHNASARFYVEQGEKYRLAKVNFLHADLPSEELRTLFPIKEGAVFDTSKIRMGLEGLRKAYGRRGYINFTAVPDTKIREETRLIELNLDLEIGKQFHVRQIGVAGLSDDRFQQFYALFPLKEGAVFDSEAFERFFHEHPEFGPQDFAIETDTITKQDPIASTVDLRIDLSGYHIKWPEEAIRP